MQMLSADPDPCTARAETRKLVGLRKGLRVPPSQEFAVARENAYSVSGDQNYILEYLQYPLRVRRRTKYKVSQETRDN